MPILYKKPYNFVSFIVSRFTGTEQTYSDGAINDH
jgi:hypothetical protein